MFYRPQNDTKRKGFSLKNKEFCWSVLVQEIAILKVEEMLD